MTRAELATYDGQNNRPAYVAVGGIVYDVSDSPMWQNGRHAQAHQAGCDLTLELKSAPHIAAVIERFPSVDRLIKSPEPPSAPRSKAPIMAIIIVVVLVLVWTLMR
ncbi:MAG: hypothetical protein L3J63_00915 [Geopsychrobacter sp.]|nr:hypothetical protein [Geopsychrobacter sp.]